MRLGRSLLATGGVILAIAFLTYIVCSDALDRHVAAHGSPRLLEQLQADGALAALDDADARAQTWWMVGLALLISFVGILNAMMLSVTERFSEIGTMKCLGALDSFIIKLFLLESLFQGVIGTIAGMVIGVSLTVVEGLAACGSELWALIPFAALARLLGICLAVGTALTVGGALYPAWRAARMQPVEAMRSEV